MMTKEQLAYIRERHALIETVPIAMTNQAHIDRRALLRDRDEIVERLERALEGKWMLSTGSHAVSAYSIKVILADLRGNEHERADG